MHLAGWKFAPSESKGNLSRTHWALLSLSVVLFVTLRCRWVGHLLVWDEAMTLCSVRSFAAGGRDAFSDWFWRHPPFYTLLLLLLQPLKTGFAERAELLSIFFGLTNQLLMFALNRRVFGVTVAVWSALFLAVMPGAVFFDVWIKQDQPVAGFGLLALLFLHARLPLYAGLCLGLALLCKETAIFYAVAIWLLWLRGVSGKRTRKDCLALILVPALTCGWWYLIVVPRVTLAVDPSQNGSASLFWSSLLHGAATEHFRFAVGSGQTNWEHSWYYYLANLPGELGWLGIVLALGGMCVALANRQRSLQVNGPPRGTDVGGLWPLALLLPAFLLLSSIRSKVPWVVIPLFPAWATLQGLAFAAIVAFTQYYLQGRKWKCLGGQAFSVRAATLVTAACGVMVAAGSMRSLDYETVLREVDESQWRGASYSKEAATVMNQLSHDGERALVTSFHYWKGFAPGQPCPIFAYYFVRRVEVLLRPHDRSFQDLVADIKTYRLDWALLSPDPGPSELEVFGGFEHKLGLKPRGLNRAFLFRTTSLYQDLGP